MEETTTTAPEATQETAPSEEVAEQTTEATVLDNGEAVSETLYADKFKSVGDLEDSYKELQSTFSKKLGAFEGAPADGYSFEGEINPSDKPMLDMVQAWGTENQLSQAGLETLVGQYDTMQETAKAAQIDAAYAELGENADRRLSNAKDFLVANLGEDQTAALAANMNTAASIVAIEQLIALTKSPKASAAPAPQAVSREKLDALRFAVDDNGNRKMSMDPEYRKMVMAKEAALSGSTTSYVN